MTYLLLEQGNNRPLGTYTRYTDACEERARAQARGVRAYVKREQTYFIRLAIVSRLKPSAIGTCGDDERRWEEYHGPLTLPRARTVARKIAGWWGAKHRDFIITAIDDKRGLNQQVWPQ